MKINRWIVVLLGVVALATSVAALCRACDRRVVESECSEVYRRYKDRDDLSVAFVKDYRIGDSITVDVTTITAKDSASWEQLLREMNVKEITIEINRQAFLQGRKSVITYYTQKNNPAEKVSFSEVDSFDLVYYSYYERTLFIFDVKSLEQARKIRSVKIDESF